jgi:hypothetical protein
MMFTVVKINNHQTYLCSDNRVNMKTINKLPLLKILIKQFVTSIFT